MVSCILLVEELICIPDKIKQINTLLVKISNINLKETEHCDYLNTKVIKVITHFPIEVEPFAVLLYPSSKFHITIAHIYV